MALNSKSHPLLLCSKGTSSKYQFTHRTNSGYSGTKKPSLSCLAGLPSNDRKTPSIQLEYPLPGDKDYPVPCLIEALLWNYQRLPHPDPVRPTRFTTILLENGHNRPTGPYHGHLLSTRLQPRHCMPLGLHIRANTRKTEKDEDIAAWCSEQASLTCFAFRSLCMVSTC